MGLSLTVWRIIIKTIQKNASCPPRQALAGVTGSDQHTRMVGRNDRKVTACGLRPAAPGPCAAIANNTGAFGGQIEIKGFAMGGICIMSPESACIMSPESAPSISSPPGWRRSGSFFNPCRGDGQRQSPFFPRQVKGLQGEGHQCPMDSRERRDQTPPQLCYNGRATKPLGEKLSK